MMCEYPETDNVFYFTSTRTRPSTPRLAHTRSLGHVSEASPPLPSNKTWGVDLTCDGFIRRRTLRPSAPPVSPRRPRPYFYRLLWRAPTAAPLAELLHRSALCLRPHARRLRPSTVASGACVPICGLVPRTVHAKQRWAVAPSTEGARPVAKRVLLAAAPGLRNDHRLARCRTNCYEGQLAATTGTVSYDYNVSTMVSRTPRGERSGVGLGRIVAPEKRCTKSLSGSGIKWMSGSTKR
jgi:hypothetical protein